MDAPFYKSLDAGPTDFHGSYLDPIDLVLIRTSPRRDGTIVVSRRQVLNVDIARVHDNFMQGSAERIEAWVLMVEEASRLNLPGWKTPVLENLDVDVFERDQLLDSLEVMSELGFTPVTLQAQRIPQDLRQLSQAIHELGIGIC